MRGFASLFLCAGIAAMVAGCTFGQTGPQRPITVADDVAMVRSLAQPEDLRMFYAADSATQANIRNQIVTARMYIADMEYHEYEARLTKEIQEEGLAATLATLGLTTSATLVAANETKTILSGIATAVTGADKAFNDKVLLSNTIQALQTQMRADRKEQAATIYAKMLRGQGVTPIAEYTLPMALSDVDTYYQMGTISSALIGLSKTVATKETHSDLAKSKAGPNPRQVVAVREIATPTSTPIAVRPTVIREVSAPIQRVAPTGTAGEPADPALVADIRKTLCLAPDGGLDDEAHKRLNIYLNSIGQRQSDKFGQREVDLLKRLIRKQQTAKCSLFG
jgi:hypothetical protein